MKLGNFLKKVKPELENDIWMIVGLGNPGEQYSNTRHNIGAQALSYFAQQNKVKLAASGKLLRLGSTSIDSSEVHLVRSRSYVNTSGKAVHSALSKTGSSVKRTIVIYDDLDLPIGSLRLRIGGGSGGHNGIKSLIEEVGSDFIRLRIGIGRPEENGQPAYDPEIIANYVLTAAKGSEEKILAATIKQTSTAIQLVLTDGIEAASRKFNGQ